MTMNKTIGNSLFNFDNVECLSVWYLIDLSVVKTAINNKIPFNILLISTSETKDPNIVSKSGFCALKNKLIIISIIDI